MTENHGVPGSNPGPATQKSPAKADKHSRPRYRTEAYYTNWYTNALGQHRSQPIHGSFLHVRQHVGVGIHGHPYPRVAHHFLYHLGMLSADQHKRRKAMA